MKVAKWTVGHGRINIFLRRIVGKIKELPAEYNHILSPLQALPKSCFLLLSLLLLTWISDKFRWPGNQELGMEPAPLHTLSPPSNSTGSSVLCIEEIIIMMVGTPVSKCVTVPTRKTLALVNYFLVIAISNWLHFNEMIIADISHSHAQFWLPSSSLIDEFEELSINYLASSLHVVN